MKGKIIDKIINKIIQGDSVEVLKKLESDSIHLVVTSPPYNVGIRYENYNDKQNKDIYRETLVGVFRECYRLLVDGGRIVVNTPACIMQHVNSRIAFLGIDILLMLREIGFMDREIITWIKSVPSKVGGHWAVFPPGSSTSWGSWMSSSCPSLRDASEWIIVMHKGTKFLKSEFSTDITREEFLSWTTNVWYMQPNTSDRRFHPAPFPIELPKRAIKLYTGVNDIVLDPFCGIGTTCIAAKQLKRRFIGIDLSETYVRYATEKLSVEKLDV